MRVQDVMTRKVETISADEPARAALERMRSRRIRHLVVTRGSQLLGVLSDRDLTSLADRGSVETVGDRMTASVVTAKPDTTIRQAANLLRGRTIGCLPVEENGRLVGILTTTDLLELLGKGSERAIERGRRWTLKARARRPRGAGGRKGLAAR